MKKLFSILSVMFLFGLMFTSCGKSTDSNGNDPFDNPAATKDQSFKTANSLFKLRYSEDFLNLVDVTVIYTDMEGKTQEFKFEKPEEGELTINSVGTKLPASFTVQVKTAKSANYEAYLASKETIKLSLTGLPDYIVGWTDVSGEEHVLDYSSASAFLEGQEIPSSSLGDDFEEFIKIAQFTFTGTFEKSGNNVIFKSDLK